MERKDPRFPFAECVDLVEPKKTFASVGISLSLVLLGGRATSQLLDWKIEKTCIA